MNSPSYRASPGYKDVISQCTSESLYSSDVPVVVTFKTRKTLDQPESGTEHFRFGL